MKSLDDKGKGIDVLYLNFFKILDLVLHNIWLEN